MEIRKPSEIPILAGSGRPPKACERCKGLKVRCSGDKPVCARCRRLSRDCSYRHDPYPGDSSKHASQSSVRTTGGKLSRSEARSRPPRTTTTTTTSPHLRRPPFASPAPLVKSLSLDSYNGIPAPLLYNLIDLYFANVYNAHLLLHKHTFLQSVETASAKPQVVLSVCAFAAIFYHDPSGQLALKEQGFSVEWGNYASRLAYQEVETPEAHNIVAFMNLGLFWYSQGHWRRCYINRGNAMQAAHLLGYTHEQRGKERTLDSEMRRRRFWACYLMNCQAADFMYMIGPSNAETTHKLSLPWREEDYEAGKPSVPAVTLESGASNGGVFCELVKFITLWRDTYDLLKTPESSMSDRISSIYRLDGRITELWHKLPSHLHLTPENLPTFPKEILAKVLLIHTLYHQCLCALHSSIVPLFSWSAGDNTHPTARRLSASVAYEHACTASTLFESYLTHSTDVSPVTTFIAYSAYCGCAIQIPFLWCTNLSVRNRAIANVRTNLRIIHAMGKYWKFSVLLEAHFHYLYKTHAAKPFHLEDEPRYLDASQLKGFHITARHACASILGFNRILWANPNGYADEGEEITDLGGDEDDSQPSAPDQAAGAPNGLSEAAGQNQAPPPVGFTIHDEHSRRFNAPIMDGYDVQSFAAEDFFRPFLGSEALTMFPDVDDLDFSQLDADMNLDFLDSWTAPLQD